jgi:hypothetical protein
MSSTRLMYRAALAVILALVTTAACGGSNTTGTDTGTAPCSITLSGAQNGTFTCSDDLTAILGIATNQSLVGFTSAGNTPSVAVAIKFSGAPITKTYRSTDPDAVQGISVLSGSNTWLAQGSKDPTAVGSYSLTLSSVTEVPFSTDAKGYDVHGTLSATLQPDAATGAAGTIALTASF